MPFNSAACLGFMTAIPPFPVFAKNNITEASELFSLPIKVGSYNAKDCFQKQSRRKCTALGAAHIVTW